MKQNVNYIEHHRLVNFKLSEDDLTSTHISLYNALFLIWNECGFDTELSINRNDVMKLSKIGSANTYTNALKELDKKGYLKYKPSFNPLVGSKINLYRFDKGSDNGINKGSVKSSSKGTDNASDTLYKLLNNETSKLLNDDETTEQTINKYGEFKNVMLTNEQFSKAKDKYGELLDKMIIKLDSHIENLTGKKKTDYLQKNHYACFSSWVFDAIDKKPKFNHTDPKLESWFNSSMSMIKQDLRTHKEHNDVVRQNKYDSKYLLPE